LRSRIQKARPRRREGSKKRRKPRRESGRGGEAVEVVEEVEEVGGERSRKNLD